MLKLLSLILFLAINIIDNNASTLPQFTTKTYTFKKVGDLEIQLDVYQPLSSPPSQGYPLLFTLHGGGNAFFGKNYPCTQDEINEALTRGWVLVSVGYRLVPGAFLNDILQDVQDAYEWVHLELIKEVHVNLEAIIVFGPSAGGGLAVLSGYKLTPRPKAIIALYPFCTNWTDLYAYNSDTPVDPSLAEAANRLSQPVFTEYLPPDDSDEKLKLWFGVLGARKIGWLMVTHNPDMASDEVLEKLREMSASENLDKDYPPTYLAHGLNDSLVPYSQSVQLGEKLKEYNVDYVLNLVPNADHGFDSDSSLFQEYVLPAFDFAEKYIGKELEFMKK